MNSPLHIDYYSDILCVWAWIAQRRVDELQAQWGQRVAIRHRFVDVFGDSHGRIERQWSDRGGMDGFAAHVGHAVEPYETAPVHADLWRKVRPVSSAPAHLVLKAVTLLSGDKSAERLGVAMREALFRDGRDISQHQELMAIVSEQGGEPENIQLLLDDGRAMAALMDDYQTSKQLNLQGSPSWIMNDGRQILYGNVGYRVLSANVEELLRHAQDEASWC